MGAKEALTRKSVESMNYVQFISLLRETNRCPGGKDSIRRIIQNSHIDRQSKVLEVGSNTGFTSLEIARTAKCHVTGIDVVPEAVAESERLLATDTQEIQGLVEFKHGSAYEIPFPDNSFDLIVAGGATSFMSDKEKALSEYHRVLKPWGFVSITNLYYEKVPPAEVVASVSKVIGTEIKAWGYSDWMKLLSSFKGLELYSVERQYLGAQSPTKIDDYVKYFLEKDHLRGLPADVKDAIKTRWQSTIETFNENHKYLGYLLSLFRKRHVEEEPELFTVTVDG